MITAQEAKKISESPDKLDKEQLDHIEEKILAVAKMGKTEIEVRVNPPHGLYFGGITFYAGVFANVSCTKETFDATIPLFVDAGYSVLSKGGVYTIKW